LYLVRLFNCIYELKSILAVVIYEIVRHQLYFLYHISLSNDVAISPRYIECFLFVAVAIKRYNRITERYRINIKFYEGINRGKIYKWGCHIQPLANHTIFISDKYWNAFIGNPSVETEIINFNENVEIKTMYYIIKLGISSQKW